MSTKDISRFLFQPRKHYVGMRMQQGRVSLDSDHNEGAWHDDEDQRRTLLELIGPQGSPDGGFFIGYTTDDGPLGTPQPITVGVNPGVTEVIVNGVGDEEDVPNFFIMPGSMYVGGMRVEIEEPEHIAFQSDYLQNTFATDIPSDLSSSATIRRQFFFLNVWEQCVTAVEDEEFLERALGGPDTSVRVRRMRRVEYLLANEGEDCRTALERALEEQHDGFGEFVPETGELRSLGRLWIDFTGDDAEDTCAPCHPDPTGRYLGAENQAIRIMLADSNHFVWAYDNASPLYRVTISGVSDNITEDPLVTMLTQPKDEEHWPLANRVVEILPWSAILENGEKVAEEMGVFCRVSTPFTPDAKLDPPDPPKTFRLNAADGDAMTALNELIHAWDDDHPRLSDLGDGGDPRHFYVRFWHEVSLPSTPMLIPTTSTLPLGTTGLVPNFIEAGMSGDFWIAALRPETPDRTIPLDLHTNTAGVPPHGPRHFYAPLALIQSANDHVTAVEDCRKHIVPVTDTECCTVIVGDGVHSVGQYTSIQAAINALPPQGGRVCIRPGLYREEFSLHDRLDVVISGCGPQTVIESPETPTAAALVDVQRGRRLTVQSLTVRAFGQSAVALHSSTDSQLLDLKVEALVPPEGSPIVDDAPLVQIFSNNGPHVDTLEILSGRRTGLFFQDAGPPRVTIPSSSELFSKPIVMKNVTITSATSGPPATGPLALIHRTSGDPMQCLVRLENWNLLALGQFGLVCESARLELRDSVILSKSFSAAQPARSCLDLSGGQFVVTRCGFQISSQGSDDAAVRMRRGDIIFDYNEVRSGGAWGGVQICGDVGPALIRGNQISGGNGHGITLGSVLWYRSGTDPALAERREGAGKVHMNPATGLVNGNLRPGFTDPVDGFFYLAVNEGAIRDLDIVDNTITNVGTNGISILTMFGLPLDQPFIAFRGVCRIRNNVIRNNIANPASNVPIAEYIFPIGGSRFGAQTGQALPMRMMPLGGIILGPSTLDSPSPPVLSSVEISGNVVEHNGIVPTAQALAISGIVVMGGDSIRICGNHVNGNGIVTNPDHTLQTGLRAGIAVLMAGSREGSREQLAALFDDNASHAPSTCSLQIEGNRVEQPEGRALFAVGTGSMSIQNNALASLGFHGSKASPEANAEIAAIGDVVYVHNLGRPWEDVGLPHDSPQSGTPIGNSQVIFGTLGYVKDIAAGYGYDDIFFVGLGGHTLFAHNQVVYDWTIKQTSFAGAVMTLAPVALISQDHIAVHQNQFALRLISGGIALPPPPLPPPTSGEPYGGRPILTHVLAVGFTVDMNGNRVSEGLDDCEVSMYGVGFSIITSTHNIGTHCTTAFTLSEVAATTIYEAGNLSILVPSGSCTTVRLAIDDLRFQFLDLLRDRR